MTVNLVRIGEINCPAVYNATAKQGASYCLDDLTGYVKQFPGGNRIELERLLIAA